MTAEQTPLLASEAAAEVYHNFVYDRFSPGRKGSIVVLITWVGFIPCRTLRLFFQVQSHHDDTHWIGEEMAPFRFRIHGFAKSEMPGSPGILQRDRGDLTGWSRDYFTAICVSIDRFLQDRAPNGCLPFDRIGARHPGIPVATTSPRTDFSGSSTRSLACASVYKATSDLGLIVIVSSGFLGIWRDHEDGLSGALTPASRRLSDDGDFAYRLQRIVNLVHWPVLRPVESGLTRG